VKVAFHDDAWEEFVGWAAQDRKVWKRIVGLIEECRRHAYEGSGKPEPLRGNRTGWWSRRIDVEHRLVYSLREDVVMIAACRGHYD
jgi:toxin YoeB